MRKLQLLHFVLFYAILIIAFIACKKTGSNPSPAPVSKCRLSTATENRDHVSNTFTYDDSNRLITLVHVSDNDPYTKHLSYKGDSIISYIDAGVNSSTDTIVLNSFGLIATERQVVPLNTSVYNVYYTYDATGTVQSSSTGPNTATVHYTFANGDNIYQKFGDLPGSVSDTFSYYTDKPSVPVDNVQYFQLLYYGAYYYKNKHLIKSYKSGTYYTNYTYDFDAMGNVATIYLDYGTAKDTLHFTYVCP